MPTRVAVISDTHLSAARAGALPPACVELIAQADVVIHAGDLSSEEALAALRGLGTPLYAVHGNVDSPGLVRELPDTLALEVEGARIEVVHDAGPAQGRLARLRAAFPRADAVVFGHSHMPLHEEEGGFQIFNPGSPTQRRRAPRHTAGIAVAEEGRLRFEHVVV
jgi:putative phosphoesterase